MKFFITFLSFVCVVTARPQQYGPPSHPQVFEHHSSSFRVPFRQQGVQVSVQPSLSYELPTQNLGFQDNGYQDSGYQGGGYQGSGITHVSQSPRVHQFQTVRTYSTPNNNGGGFVSSNFGNNGGFSGNNGGGVFVSDSGNGFSNGGGNGFSNGGGNGFSNGGGSFGGGHSGGGSFNHGPAKTIVTKDVYVHSAPEEPVEHITHQIGGPQTNQKHYKILFIKAPSANIRNTIRVNGGGQNEEKTIVYVLVKKPELNTQILQQEGGKAPVHKPEVYFIKYKANKGHSNGGVHTAGDEGISSGVVGPTSTILTSNGNGGGNGGSGLLGDTYSSALGGIEHAGGSYPEVGRTRKSSSPYGPANYSPPAPLG